MSKQQLHNLDRAISIVSILKLTYQQEIGYKKLLELLSNNNNNSVISINDVS